MWARTSPPNDTDRTSGEAYDRPEENGGSLQWGIDRGGHEPTTFHGKYCMISLQVVSRVIRRGSRRARVFLCGAQGGKHRGRDRRNRRDNGNARISRGNIAP